MNKSTIITTLHTVVEIDSGPSNFIFFLHFLGKLIAKKCELYIFSDVSTFWFRNVDFQDECLVQQLGCPLGELCAVFKSLLSSHFRFPLMHTLGGRSWMLQFLLRFLPTLWDIWVEF